MQFFLHRQRGDITTCRSFCTDRDEISQHAGLAGPLFTLKRSHHLSGYNNPGDYAGNPFIN